MSRSGCPLLMLAVAVGAVSCSAPHESPVSPRFEIAICRPPETTIRAGCKPNDCGHNAPIANTFPINGFSATPGGCNPELVQVLPGSLRGGGCGSGADLGADGLELVGNRDGKEVCRGQELAGAEFVVRSTLLNEHDAVVGSSTLTLTVANVRSFPVEGGPPNLRHLGYRIESGGEPLCTPAVATQVRWQLGLKPRVELNLPDAEGYVAHPDADLAVPITGELFDNTDDLMTSFGPAWFSLGCIDDALAKSALYGMRKPNEPDRNKSALRLLTGNYCNKGRYTMRGVVIEWIDEQRAPEVEAGWSKGTVKCFGSGRLTRLKTPDGAPIDPRTLPDALQPAGCKRPEGTAQTQPAPCDDTAWNDAIRVECGITEICDRSWSNPSIAIPDGLEFISFIHDSRNVVKVIQQTKR